MFLFFAARPRRPLALSYGIQSGLTLFVEQRNTQLNGQTIQRTKFRRGLFVTISSAWIVERDISSCVTSVFSNTRRSNTFFSSLCFSGAASVPDCRGNLRDTPESLSLSALRERNGSLYVSLAGSGSPTQIRVRATSINHAEPIFWSWQFFKDEGQFDMIEANTITDRPVSINILTAHPPTNQRRVCRWVMIIEGDASDGGTLGLEKVIIWNDFLPWFVSLSKKGSDQSASLCLGWWDVKNKQHGRCHWLVGLSLFSHFLL